MVPKIRQQREKFTKFSPCPSPLLSLSSQNYMSLSPSSSFASPHPFLTLSPPQIIHCLIVHPSIHPSPRQKKKKRKKQPLAHERSRFFDPENCEKRYISPRCRFTTLLIISVRKKHGVQSDKKSEVVVGLAVCHPSRQTMSAELSPQILESDLFPFPSFLLTNNVHPIDANSSILRVK